MVEASAEEAASMAEASAEEAASMASEDGIASEPVVEGSWKGEGEPPSGFSIKGNANSMLYHRPDSSLYNRTKAGVWFEDEAAAQAAGFTLAGSHPKTKDAKTHDEELESGGLEPATDESAEGGESGC